jgi:hypothetical protein
MHRSFSSSICDFTLSDHDWNNKAFESSNVIAPQSSEQKGSLTVNSNMIEYSNFYREQPFNSVHNGDNLAIDQPPNITPKNCTPPSSLSKNTYTSSFVSSLSGISNGDETIFSASIPLYSPNFPLETYIIDGTSNPSVNNTLCELQGDQLFGCYFPPTPELVKSSESESSISDYGCNYEDINPQYSSRLLFEEYTPFGDDNRIESFTSSQDPSTHFSNPTLHECINEEKIIKFTTCYKKNEQNAMIEIKEIDRKDSDDLNYWDKEEISKQLNKKSINHCGSSSCSPRSTSSSYTSHQPTSSSASKTCCSNCHTFNTPLWRRTSQGLPLCNACGLFLKLHGTVRPLSLKTDVIKKRNRSSSTKRDTKNRHRRCHSRVKREKFQKSASLSPEISIQCPEEDLPINEYYTIASHVNPMEEWRFLFE